MKRWQQLLSFYLVLCVAFAGAVGISPVLHVIAEHGGHGPAHSHAGFRQAIASEHAHPHPHTRNVPESRPPAVHRIVPDHSPSLFGHRLSDVYRAIGAWIAHAIEHLPETPEGGHGGHTHHSLAQLLLSGTVEGISNVPPLVCVPTVFTLSAAILPTFFIASDFEAQTASRAPPVRV